MTILKLISEPCYVITHAITIRRVFDQQIGQFRPFVEPVTHLMDLIENLMHSCNHLQVKPFS